MHGGHGKVRCVSQQRAKLVQALRLAHVVGLFVQLAFGFGQQGRYIQVARQQARHAQQRGHVVHITVDALADAGVLHLDGQVAPIVRAGAVHLPDGCCGQRGKAKLRKALLPARAPRCGQHGIHLPNRHRFGVRSQPRQDVGQLRGQQVACVHRDQLPHFHRCAAQLRQLVCHPAGVGGGEHQVACAGHVALRPLPCTLCQHAACQSRRHRAHAGHARPAAAGHGCAAVGAVLLRCE